MEQELKWAAQIGDIDAFYGVIEREPEILKMIEEKHFVETPLHVAAQHGQTELSIEILSLMPSFGKKLNPSGYSPLYMALHNGQIEAVKQLIKFDPELIMVRGRERKTPLHYVAETNDADLVADFLVACPTAIKELTIRGETAVHLAVLRACTRAFQVLMGWITRTGNKEILGWKDNKGNTLLHIAAQTGQVEVIKRLMKEKLLIDLDDKNLENQTALDIIKNRMSSQESIENPTTLHIAAEKIPNQDDVEIEKMLRRAGARESSEFPNVMSMADILTNSYNYRRSITRALARARVDLEKGITDNTRNAYLVVTVLIVTATFQAVLSPPGGGWLKQDDNNNSNISTNYKKDNSFYKFIILNSVTFATSIVLTYILLMPMKRYYSFILPFSLISLMFSYALCGIHIAPPDKRTFTKVCLMSGAFLFYGIFLKSIFPSGMMRKLFPRLATKKDIIKASMYEMEKKVRLGKYAASGAL